MTAADDVARLLTLVPWLLERPGASISEIAESFGVAEHTVRSDLAQLDFCGLPGLRGGDLFEVDIVGDRVLLRMADELRRPLRISPREALRLVLTVEAVADAFGDDLPALRSAVDEVRRAAGIPLAVRVEVDSDGSRWVTAIRRAITAGRQLRISYASRHRTEPTERDVDPWALHVADGAWYLQGHDHRTGERRTFRLDRILSLSETGPVEVVRPDGELPPPVYSAGPEDTIVELELTASSAWVADAIHVDEAVATPGGGRRIRFHTDALSWVKRLVLMAGGGVTVREPRTLADAVRGSARAALAEYEP